MWPWTARTQGHLYIFHFNAPLGNLSNRRAQAMHYCGFAEDLDARIAKQLAGKGAKIVAAALFKGLIFELYHWPACLATEKLVKRTKNTARYCPACCAAAGRAPRPLPVPTPAEQLVLPLDEELPAIEIGRVTWAEIQAAARARRYFIVTPSEERMAQVDDLL